MYSQIFSITQTYGGGGQAAKLIPWWLFFTEVKSIVMSKLFRQSIFKSVLDFLEFTVKIS